MAQDKPIEENYTEKPVPTCPWYGTACNEKKCDGNGFVRDSIARGTLSHRVQGEYAKATFGGTKSRKILCASFLDKTSYDSRNVGNY